MVTMVLPTDARRHRLNNCVKMCDEKKVFYRKCSMATLDGNVQCRNCNVLSHWLGTRHSLLFRVQRKNDIPSLCPGCVSTSFCECCRFVLKSEFHSLGRRCKNLYLNFENVSRNSIAMTTSMSEIAVFIPLLFEFIFDV
uniref:Uncharacterized protein n=1 Tax=Strigamia maritima TaxID=126957 RepID=T1J698_STRMM